jgi:hypothetical protein
VLLLAAFSASLPLLAADETILPHGWDPSVADAVDYLKSEDSDAIDRPLARRRRLSAVTNGHGPCKPSRLTLREYG